MICPICAGEMREVIPLPRFPMTEHFEPWSPSFEHGRGCVDQALMYCEPCSYAGLAEVIPPEMLYGEGYRTATAASVGASHSVNAFHDFILRSVNVADYYGTVIDVGANDCTLLAKFPLALRVAVDPNASGDAVCVREYVENARLEEYAHQRKLILCSHTLEHVGDPEAMLRTIHGIMTEADVAAFQFPSLDALVRDARIDQVHHQHLHYFSLRAASLLLAKCGFNVFAHEFDDAHYGTLRLAFRKGAGEVMGRAIREHEIDHAFVDFQVEMGAFNAAVRRLRDPVCYGASLMFPVLAYYSDALATIDEVIDENESRWGQRWINVNKKIIEPTDVNGRSVVVTAFNTRMAVRKIASKLGTLGARDIVVPFHNL